MKSISKEALVGAVVLVAIAAFVAGTLWLRGKSPGGDAVYVVYSDVETLKEASSVRISGASVGRVDGIDYVAPGKVVVGLKLDKKNHIVVTSTATAVVTAVGVLGDYMVVLDPGKGKPLARGDTIQGTIATGVMDRVGTIAAKASETMTRLNAMFDTQLVVDLRHTIGSARHFMDYLADQKNGPTSQVNPTMVALQKTTARMDSIVGQIDAKKLQFRVDSTMASASKAADRLSALSQRADSLMTRIQRNDGTLGRFMNDTTLYVNLTHTLQAMTDLLNEIKKNPGKIGVTVKVF
jgi:phospholipid/cholesterol/gamma-HCH transport system substrate-binding protein